MIKESVSMAFAAIRATRFRSFLTMLGSILGVSSVIVVVGLGQGLRSQVSSQIGKLGSTLVIVQPGKKAHTTGFGIDSLQGMQAGIGGVLTEQDLTSISKTAGVQTVAPVATMSGAPTADEHSFGAATVVGSNEHLPDILHQKVAYGTFFTKDDQDKNYAIIGPGAAAGIFGESVPIGKPFQIRGTEFIVQGVFEQMPVTPLAPSINFNNAVVIPYGKAKDISGGSLQINQVLITTTAAKNTPIVSNNISRLLTKNHGGQEDFTVLNQEEAVNISDGVFSQLTTFTTGVAAIALFVGSIGIMNIMFASVSERTREIGIRKAIGATNRQIVSQFVVEATTLSVLGGIIGIVLALAVIGLIRAASSLQPIISLPIIGISFGISLGAGLLAGILPAVKAARKDPIESLRY